MQRTLLETAMVFSPIVAGTVAATITPVESWWRWRAQESRRLLQLLWSVAWKLALVGAVCAILEGAVLVVLFVTYKPNAVRLTEQVSKGMTLAEVRQRAAALGFLWKVHVWEENGKPGPLHFMCHTTSEGAEICENWETARSFAGLWGSHSCNVILNQGLVTEVSLYMD